MDNTTTNVQGQVPKNLNPPPPPPKKLFIGEVKDGDTVHIDAETGTVTKISGIIAEGLIDHGV